MAALWAGSCAHLPLPTARAPVVSGDHLTARMISETAALVPGTMQRIGVCFSIQPGWHLYGPSRSDSGLPILLAPSAPEGFRFEPPLWPAPRRLISEGVILDHVYENELVVVLPLEVPRDVKAARTVTLRCRADWLVCHPEAGCVPGHGEVEMTLPIVSAGAAAPHSADSARIQAALERVPRPQALLASEVTRSDGAWNVRVPGATALEFYPDTTCAPLMNPIADAASSGDRLALRLAAEAPDSARLAGILEVTNPRGSRFYQVDFPRPPDRAGLPSKDNQP